MQNALPPQTPNDDYGWVYSTSTFWYIGIHAWQGARHHWAAPARPECLILRLFLQLYNGTLHAGSTAAIMEPWCGHSAAGEGQAANTDRNSRHVILVLTGRSVDGEASGSPDGQMTIAERMGEHTDVFR